MSESCITHIEFAWRAKTNAANLLFEAKKFKEASLIYKEALYRAEVLNSHQTLAQKMKIPFMQVFTVSCNNLAFAYEELSEMEESKKMLERVILYLLCLLRKKGIDKQNIKNELKTAFLNYSAFANKHNIHIAEQKKLFLKIQQRQAV